MKFRLGVIGAGVMANAIIDRAVEKGVLHTKEIIVFDVNQEAINNMSQKGYTIAKSAQNLLDNAKNVLLSVKPQHYSTILKANSFKNTQCLISIMAGVKINTLKKLIDNNNLSFARIMPNTPCKIGKGFSGITFENASETAQKFAEDLFASCGETLHIDEEKFDAVTSVSGSGPAYIYLFLNGMIKGGMNGGLDYESAKKMAISTIMGGAELAKQSSNSMNELVDKVCSKGGTTIEAIEYFRNNNLEDIIAQGINKCRNKSKRLSDTL